MASGLVSASVFSRVVAVNSSHVKGGEWPDGVSASVHWSAAEIFAKLRAVEKKIPRLFEFHRSHSTSTNIEPLKVWTSQMPSEQGLRCRPIFQNYRSIPK
ncbi:hypothetical protein AVEN_117840-1 [Araneus ventricosus]|uniref:Uncharacterized protein n=1 Tax=Araneus ventricosus TaxID=182803 RepID=A0A4Y2NI68_ARAVE|nr:hypothetical protein AVEN_117840-1 [Araneus ventricosus]